MSNDRFEVEADQPYREKSGMSGCLKGCLIVGGILLLLVAAVVIWLAMSWKGLVAGGASQIVDAAIDQSDLPEQEKVEVKAQVARVAEAFESGELPLDKAGEVITQIMQSPVMPSIIVAGIEAKYFDSSGLSDDEKEAGRVALNRFVSGMLEEKIGEEDFEEAMSKIADKQPNGQWQMRDSVTDDELRELVQLVKEKADAAEIPEEIEEVDPSDEMKQIIDSVLGDAAAEAPADAALE